MLPPFNKPGAHPFHPTRHMLVCHQNIRACLPLCWRFRRKVPKQMFQPLRPTFGRHLDLHLPLSPRLLQFRLNIHRQHQISSIVLTFSHVVFRNRRSATMLLTLPMPRIVSYWFGLDSHIDLTPLCFGPQPIRTIMANCAFAVAQVFHNVAYPIITTVGIFFKSPSSLLSCLPYTCRFVEYI